MAEKYRVKPLKTRDRKKELPPPYLDRLSSLQLHRDPKHERYKRLLIQPISIPGLGHTGVATSFRPASHATFVKPDGSASVELRSYIRKKVKSLPRIQTQDILQRDIAAGRSVYDFREPYDMENLAKESISRTFSMYDGILSPKRSPSNRSRPTPSSPTRSVSSSEFHSMPSSDKLKKKKKKKRSRRNLTTPAGGVRFGGDSGMPRADALSKLPNNAPLGKIEGSSTTGVSPSMSKFRVKTGEVKEMGLGRAAAWSLGGGVMPVSPNHRRDQPCFQCLLTFKCGTRGTKHLHGHYQWMIDTYGGGETGGEEQGGSTVYF